MIKKFSLIMLLMFSIPCHSAEFKFDIRKIFIATTASFLSYISTGRSTWRSFSQTAIKKIHSILRPLITAPRSGDYKLETEIQRFSGFATELLFSVPGELHIRHSDSVNGQASIAITADKEDLQYLISSRTNQELKLRLGLWAAWFHSFKKAPKYVVTITKELKALSISVNGLDTLRLNDLDLSTLGLTCSGSTKCIGSAIVGQFNLKAYDNAHIALQGKAPAQDLELNDSAAYNAQKLQSEDITIAVRNTSSAKICAYKTLTLKPGTGLIEIYNSDPTIINKQEFSGKVIYP